MHYFFNYLKKIFYFFILIHNVTLVFTQVSPEKIILEPYSCVNVSLLYSESYEDITIHLIAKDGTQLLTYFSNGWYPYSKTLYLFKYVHSHERSWITLCDIDYIIEGTKINFKYRNISGNQNSYSDNIKLASCNYTTNCQNVVYPKAKNLFDKINLFKSGKNIYTKKLIHLSNFSIYEMVLSSHYVNTVASFGFNNIFRIMLQDNLIQYDVLRGLLSFNVRNNYFFQHTLHLIYIDNSVFKLFTIEFDSDKVSHKMNQNEISIKYFKNFYPSSYDVFLGCNEWSQLLYFESNNSELEINIKNVSINFHNLSIILSKNLYLTYAILFINYKFYENGYYFYQTYYIYIDLNYSDISEENRKNSMTNISIRLRKKYPITYMVIGCISFIFLTGCIGYISFKMYGKRDKKKKKVYSFV